MEREKVEIEQKELTILERGMAEFMGEGLMAMDRDGYCIYVNATAGRMLGYPPRTLLGQNAHEVVHGDTCEPGDCPIVLALHSERVHHVDDSVAAFRQKDRDPLPVAYTTSPILDGDLIQGVVLTFVDASARRAHEQELVTALADKDDEIEKIQQVLNDIHQIKNKPNPSEQLLEKIRKLLG